MSILFYTSFVSLIFLLSCKPTFAYLDPGTGSYILQLIIGALLGGVFAIKMYYRKIKSFTLNLFKEKNKEDEKHK